MDLSWPVIDVITLRSNAAENIGALSEMNG
jgi:hypothetical protein